MDIREIVIVGLYACVLPLSILVALSVNNPEPESACIEVNADKLDLMLMDMAAASNNCDGFIETVKGGEGVYFTCVGWEKDRLERFKEIQEKEKHGK